MNYALFPYGVAPSCVLSDCSRYRYELRIPLGSGAGSCLFILANPSTAIVQDGVFVSDPTITRCQNFAKAWGYGVLVVANVRAWRETNPKLVPTDPLAVGPENDQYIADAVEHADLIVCGWGKLGGEWRSAQVRRLIRGADKIPYALGLNNDGSPKHPLYLRADAKPFAMDGT